MYALILIFKYFFKVNTILVTEKTDTNLIIVSIKSCIFC